MANRAVVGKGIGNYARNKFVAADGFTYLKSRFAEFVTGNERVKSLALRLVQKRESVVLNDVLKGQVIVGQAILLLSFFE